VVGTGATAGWGVAVAEGKEVAVDANVAVGVGVCDGVGETACPVTVGWLVWLGDKVAPGTRTANVSSRSAGSQNTRDAHTQPIRFSHSTAIQSPSAFRPRGRTLSL
jgi:hypothetical protein